MTGLLAIETSFEACSVALAVDETLLRREFHQPRQHAELLLPAVRELLEEGGVALPDLQAIAFGRGPGSFTSLRIGIGVVQGLAWGADIGVVPVSSLAALALGAARAHAGGEACTVVAAMDARMDEVFHARFEVTGDGEVTALGDEAVSAPERVGLPAPGDLIGVGNGFSRYPALAQHAGRLAAVYTDLWPSAVDVIHLASLWLASRPALPAHLAQPVYVRDKVADKPAER